MLNNTDYCDYDTCIALKELGYNDVTQFFFNKDEVRTPRIPLYEAQKFLREEKKVHIEVYACAGGYIGELCKAYETTTFSGGTTIYTPNDEDNPKLNDAGKYDSYEEALLERIKEAIKILKGK